MAGKKNVNETTEDLIDVGEENEKAVDIELGDEDDKLINKDEINPNVDDQLDKAASGEGDTDDSTPKERATEYVKPDATKDDDKEDSEQVKRRIGKLTYQMREAERREAAAVEFAQGVQKENLTLKDKQLQQDGVFIEEHKSRIESDMTAAQQQYREAHDLGDAALISEATTNLAKHAARLTTAEATQARFKKHVETKPVETEIPPYQPPAAPGKTEDTRPAPDPRAVAWAERNEWFGEDQAMTNGAMQIHKQLVTTEGFIASGDGYYAELDKRIRKNFPNSFRAPKLEAQQVVTGGDVSTSNTPRGTKRSVRLSASQVAIAKKLGVPLEEYAKYV